MTWANPEARREMLAALKETGILRNYEMEILTKNKEVRTCSISVKLDTNQGYIEGTVLDITERKQAESKIKESEEKFRKVFENSPMGKSLTSIDGKLSVNDTFCEIVGYPKEELSQMNWREISHPGDMEATQNFISSMLSGAINNAQFHKRYIHKSGEVVWADFATYLQRDSNGEPQFFITSVSDITKQTEEELYQLNNELERRITERTATLRKNKEQFKTMFTKAPLGIALIDSFTGKIKKANPIYARITGRTIREITATDWMSITHPDDIHLDIENMNLLNDGKIEGFRREKRYIHKNGDIVWINMTIAPLKIEKEYNPHHLCMIEDITERKKDEEALHVINSRNHAILKAIPDLVFRINSDGVFLDYRTQESSDLYVSPDKIIGQRVEDILPPDIASLITRRIHTLMESGEIQEFEYALPMPDGLRYFDARMAISDTDEVIIIVRNITDRKKVENELIKAKERAEESDRLKSSFLANMSHEIRTPMNGILGFADLLKEPNLTGEQQQEYIQIIEKSGARMLNIINNIIDISKIEANLVEVNIKPSNINEQTAFIYTFFESQTEKKGINLICKNGLPDERAIINTDKEKVYAILTNLVRNAFKYCDEGGIEFGYNLKGKHLEFFVKDTGIGIPDNRQQAIFDRFIQADVTDTRAFQGAGLGLSISKAYVEILGGKIWVESEEGKGSTFYFTIPYNTESEEKNLVENVVPDDEANNYAKNLNILIAEDDKISRMLLTKTIKVFSKEIIEALDGVEALEACQNNPDIDLVMMDINMPNMDGHEATRQIRQFNKNVIIIAQTANAFDSDKKEAMESGCNDFISKPIMKNELLGLINKYF
ncbi:MULTISPECIES: PAS domain S-box protein [unclassified Flavobacterium]|jgi:PAS domain S-box-containing protein|uniref:PAS domain S-box protein n=1 Tax=unclassified Flavobacterium TaxID=196869 RepID=UPI0025BAECC7|nr:MULTISPECIES: PAS domain S-box protein [unclassified Flavobacterium]